MNGFWVGTGESYRIGASFDRDGLRDCGVSLEIHEGNDLCHDWAVMYFLSEAKKA